MRLYEYKTKIILSDKQVQWCTDGAHMGERLKIGWYLWLVGWLREIGGNITIREPWEEN